MKTYSLKEQLEALRRLRTACDQAIAGGETGECLTEAMIEELDGATMQVVGTIIDP